MSTGGEGGMVTTNDKGLWQRIWSLKDHGKSYQAVYERDHPPGFRWLHESFGSNYRMTEMQAAIGRIQLTRMAQWTLQRTVNAQRIRQAAQECEVLRVPSLGCADPNCVANLLNVTQTDNRDAQRTVCCVHAQYKCYLFVRNERLAPDWNRDRIMNEINKAGVPCFSGSCSEVYLEKAFDGTGWRPEQRLPIAKDLGETSLMFLIHPTLTNTEIDKTCEIIQVVCREAQA